MEKVLTTLYTVATPQQVVDCLQTLLTFIQNIITSPFEAKYRVIKPKNNTVKTKVFGIPGIERLIVVLGYQFDGENYVVSDEMLGVLLDSEPYLSIHKRLLQARISSETEYERELVVARNQMLVLRKRRK